MADVTASTFLNPPARQWNQQQQPKTVSTAAPGTSVRTTPRQQGRAATSSRPAASIALRSRTKNRPSAPEIAGANGSGGEVKASSGSLLLFDLAARKTLWISRALGKVDSVIGLEPVSATRALALTSDKRLALFDVDSQKIVAKSDLSAYENFPRGQGSKVLVRHQGKFYLIFRNGFALVNPDTCQITRFWKTKAGIQCGGAFLNDRAYYIGDDRHWHEATLK